MASLDVNRNRRYKRERDYDSKRKLRGDVQNERYSRDGNMSPLRSPLRPEQHQDRKRPRHRHSDNKRIGTNRYFDSDMNTEVLNFEEDFPPLDNPSCLPESREKRNSLTKPTDWAVQVEQFEEMERLERCTPESRQSNSMAKSFNKSSEEDQFKERQRLASYKRRLEMDKAKDAEQDVETDMSILQRRQKCIDYGKNTICYDRYRALVSKDKRTRGHPHTPDKHVKTSRRSWDMQIKIWRRSLHKFDLPITEERKENCNGTEGEDDTTNLVVPLKDLEPMETDSGRSSQSSSQNSENHSSASSSLTEIPAFTLLNNRNINEKQIRSDKSGDFFSSFDLDECLNADDNDFDLYADV